MTPTKKAPRTVEDVPECREAGVRLRAINAKLAAKREERSKMIRAQNKGPDPNAVEAAVAALIEGGEDDPDAALEGLANEEGCDPAEIQKLGRQIRALERAQEEQQRVLRRERAKASRIVGENRRPEAEAIMQDLVDALDRVVELDAKWQAFRQDTAQACAPDSSWTTALPFVVGSKIGPPAKKVLEDAERLYGVTPAK